MSDASRRISTQAYAIISLPDPAKPVIGIQDRSVVRPVKVLLSSSDAESIAREMRREVFERLSKGGDPEQYVNTLLAYRASIRVVACILEEPKREE